MKHSLIASWILSSLSWVSAQPTASSPGEGAASKARFTLLAIGDLPPVTLTDTKNESYYNEASESEVPPSTVFVRFKDDFKPLPITLNSSQPRRDLPPGSQLNLYTQVPETPDSKSAPYVSIGIPQGKTDDITVCLLRNPATKSWRTKPIALLFLDNQASFPTNSTRVMNLCSHAVAVKMGNSSFNLAPRASRVVPYPAGARGTLGYKIGARIKDQNVLIADSADTFYSGTRMNLVVYDTDGKSDRPGTEKPVKYVTFLETPQAPPAKSQAPTP